MRCLVTTMLPWILAALLGKQSRGETQTCERNVTGTDSNDTLSNVTKILNELLDNYDKRLRPGYHKGVPTQVYVDINIRSMGPVSEKDMTYKMDAYFRQTWDDDRLKFKVKGINMLVVSIKTLEKMWRPDTYFFNGLGSYLHMITTPNKLVRIFDNGTILYSMRLTIKASCPMYLHYFPVDQQNCPLQFGSYAYTKEQVVYKWKHGGADSISTAKDMRLSQFDLVDTPAQSLNMSPHPDLLNRGLYSTLKVNFVLNRHMGYFLIQVYVPCSLIVVLSWVSFWINREATADRLSLGILTELTLTTLSMDTRDDLPKVPYPTALDWFVILCYAFVSAVLLEYAAVHYFTKIDSGEVQHDPWSDEEEDEEEDDDEEVFIDTEEEENNIQNELTGTYYTSNSDVTKRTITTFNHVTNARNGKFQTKLMSVPKKPAEKKENFFFKFIKCLQGSSKYRKQIMKRANPSGVNTISRIDKVSRILFPGCFVVLSVFYWITFSRFVDVDVLK